MGVHESNRGLCGALYRAFRVMNCRQHVSLSDVCDEPAKHVSLEEDDRQGLCENLAHRLRVRGCSIPEEADDADDGTGKEMR